MDEIDMAEKGFNIEKVSVTHKTRMLKAEYMVDDAFMDAWKHTIQQHVQQYINTPSTWQSGVVWTPSIAPTQSPGYLLSNPEPTYPTIIPKGSKGLVFYREGDKKWTKVKRFEKTSVDIFVHGHYCLIDLAEGLEHIEKHMLHKEAKEFRKDFAILECANEPLYVVGYRKHSKELHKLHKLDMIMIVAAHVSTV